MSVVIAVEKRGGIVVVCDTLTTTGSQTSPCKQARRKVFQTADSLIAVAGFSAYYTALECYLKKRDSHSLHDESGIFEFFLSFWRWLRDECHFVNDQADTDDPTPFADLDVEFIVASRAGLFCVGGILGVSRYDRFCAIGTGASHAEGAAAVLYDQLDSARDIARQAVEVACQFDRASGGETLVFEVDKEPESEPESGT